MSRNAERWLALFGLFGVSAIIVVVFRYYSTEAERRYAAISGDMTVADVTRLMGRKNDGGGEMAAGRTKSGRLWQTWDFPGWRRLSVDIEYEDDGRITEKSLWEFTSEKPYGVLIDRQTFPSSH